MDWAKDHKNPSILLPDIIAEAYYFLGKISSANTKRLMCRLEDGVVYSSFPSILMSPGDPVLERVTEIFDRFFETGPYNS
jgi:hypothetical protein